MKLLRRELVEDIAEQNEARRANGLPEMKIVVRTCLVCKSQFQSVTRRICCDPEIPYLLDIHPIKSIGR